MRGRQRTRPPTSEPTASTARDPDASAVAAARSDSQAFAPLYDRYVDPVYRYCIRRLGHPEAAADATGQIFAKALTALPRYREDVGSFRSWLFAIAHNVLVDEARTRHCTTTLEAAADVADRAPSVEEEMLTHETARTIRALLAQLTPDQRQVMELRLAGLTGPEIAVTVGRSLGAVKIAQVRAIARLRDALTDAEAAGQEVTHAQR